MKHLFLLFFVFSVPTCIVAQVDSTSTTIELDSKSLLKEISVNACKCIDSVDTYNKSKKEISKGINSCIDKQMMAYQLGKQLSSIKDLLKEKEGNYVENKQVNVEINVNPESDSYKKNYYEMETYLMDNCPAVKDKIAANDQIGEKSLSNNPDAMRFYELALDETKLGNFEKAIDYYKKALVYDKEFAFAYDNMGICYRRLNEFDKAIESYEKSLEIDPNGMMPLQNIGIVYIYKKQYKKAVKSYEKLAKIDPDNPEVYYGLGNVYAVHLAEYEKALTNLCIAYRIYTTQKSPYRSDAEKLIQIVYDEMKKEGKEDKFDEILKKNNINHK
jgi:tetratricopeptide (TPR) repeat protein